MDIDLQLAVEEQYGSAYSLVALGTHRDDWRALYIPVGEYVVLPVLLVAEDLIANVADVDRALDDYASFVYRTQIFYWERAGATFRVIEPIVLPSRTRVYGWHLAEDVAEFVDPAGRFVMLHQAAQEYTEQDAPPSGAVIAAISPYTGVQPLRGQGAGATGRFAVVPPRASSVECPLGGAANALDESYCHNSVYALAHELGHVFGLQHSCDEYPDDPDAPYSVMQFDTPTHLLLGPEVHILRSSPYFTIDSGGAPSMPVPPPGLTCP